MRALVVDPRRSRAGLAAVRGLALGGWTVGVAGPEDAPAARSRFCHARSAIVRPEEDDDRFLAEVRALVDREGYEVVFACSDLDVLSLSAGRERLGPATLGYPAHERVVDALDKLELQAAAQRAGLAVPRTWTGEAPPTAGRPLIVKEQVRSSLGVEPGVDRVLTTRVDSAAELERALATIAAAGNEALVQEHVQGDLVALTVVADDDARPVARVQQRAEAIYPHGAGASVRGRTTAVDRDLLARTEVLLGDLGWRGLAQLQFLVPAGGEPHLIDLNPRFYGSLALAIAAGVNLPAIWAALATGRQPPAGQVEGRAGVRYQCLPHDVFRMRVEFGASRRRAALSCLRYGIGAAHAHASLRDPRPGFDAALELLGRST